MNKRWPLILIGCVAVLPAVVVLSYLGFAHQTSPAAAASTGYGAADTPTFRERPAGRIYRLLVVNSPDAQVGQSKLAADSRRKCLELLGYVEGKNLEVTIFSISRAKDLKTGLTGLVHQLREDYDAVLLDGTVAAEAAKLVAFNKTHCSFVFCNVADPVDLGLVEDLAGPAKFNFTGVAGALSPTDRLDFVRRALPAARKIGLVYLDEPRSQNYRTAIEELIRTDPEHRFAGFELLARPVPKGTISDNMEDALAAARPLLAELEPQVDAFLSSSDDLGEHPGFARLVCETVGGNKPLVGLNRADVMAGRGAALAAFPSPRGTGKQVARMIARLFEAPEKGIRDIAPEYPRESSFAFDLDKLARFGIARPTPDLLEQAGGNILRPVE